MKDSKQTLLEVINYCANQHPELAPTIEAIALEAQRKIQDPSDADFLLTLNQDLLSKSKAQLRQDIFVLYELNFKRGGFFVEFGATNGIDLSNTYLLETEYQWNGILAEPATLWHADLAKNRRVNIDKRCVWKTSGSTLTFNETKYPEYSTIQSFSETDLHAKEREGGKSYTVETISLIDLLEKYRAPNEIDYLSIDTEGSEFEILENFDFEKFKFNVITCEHNGTSMREKLYSLLIKNGYRRKYELVSCYDDWYVRA